SWTPLCPLQGGGYCVHETGPIQSLLRGIQSLLRGIEPLPQDIQPLLWDIEALPRGIEPLPRDIQPLPWGIEPLPRDIEALPRGIQSLPRNVALSAQIPERPDESQIVKEGFGLFQGLAAPVRDTPVGAVPGLGESPAEVDRE